MMQVFNCDYISQCIWPLKKNADLIKEMYLI